MNDTTIPWRTTRHPGVAIHTYARGPGDRAVALIRMAPGRGYPAHLHRGPEHVLVLAGGYRDAAGQHRAGSFVYYPAGSTHSPVALDSGDGVACVLLAVAHEGIELLGA